MSETNRLKHVWIEVCKDEGTKLFRNNNGALRDVNGRLVRYGLGPGTSDLIGWKCIRVKPEMVGSTLAVFMCVEIKEPDGRITEDQAQFIHVVKKHGGIACVALSPEDVEQSIKNWMRHHD